MKEHLAIFCNGYVLIWDKGWPMQKMTQKEYNRWLQKRYRLPKAYSSKRPGWLQRLIDRLF